MAERKNKLPTYFTLDNKGRLVYQRTYKKADGETKRFTIRLGEKPSGKRIPEDILDRYREEYKRQAESWEREQHFDNKNITLEQFYDGWLEEQRKAIKPGTIRNYKIYWKNIKPVLGSKKVVNIYKADVQTLQKTLKAKGKSDKANNSTLKVLSTILNQAVRERIIDFNPCSVVKKYKLKDSKVHEKGHRALTNEELTIFFGYAKDSMYYNTFRLMLETGMRAGEALALTVFDVDFTKKRIRVHRTISEKEDSGYYVSDTPKTPTSERSIPMNDYIVSIIREQIERNKLLHNDCSILFPNKKGGYANGQSLSSAIRGAYERAKKDGKPFERFGCHAFRDTFATRKIQEGVQPNTLKKVLGHKHISTTLDIYAHVLEEMECDAVAKEVFAV